MADRDTPFVFDEWYVAARSSEIGWTRRPRTLLGKEVVLYRTLEGQVVALDDRCGRRSYPLSAGTLDDDTVICGYHGFRYDANGDLVEVPSQERCPRGLGVHRYPVREIGPLVWIYMDPAAEPRVEPPSEASLSPSRWALSDGYLRLNGNYVSLHENLLDLTHLTYVHAKSFGTPDYAARGAGHVLRKRPACRGADSFHDQDAALAQTGKPRIDTLLHRALSGFRARRRTNDATHARAALYRIQGRRAGARAARGHASQSRRPVIRNFGRTRDSSTRYFLSSTRAGRRFFCRRLLLLLTRACIEHFRHFDT